MSTREKTTKRPEIELELGEKPRQWLWLIVPLAVVEALVVAAILIKGYAGLDAISEHEMAQYGPFVTNQMRNHFAAHELMQTGLLPSGHWQTFAAALERSMYRSNGVRELWAERRDEFPEEFRKLVDGIAARAESAGVDQPN